jgi:hypothetical protein
VKVLAKLRHGVVEIAAGDDCRYADPSFLQRAYLLWTFRNFRRLSVRILNQRQRRILERLSDVALTEQGKGIDPAVVIGRAEFPALQARKPPSPVIVPYQRTAETQTAVGVSHMSPKRVSSIAKLPNAIARHAAETIATSARRRTRSHARYSLVLTLALVSLVIISGAVAQRLWINHGKQSPSISAPSTQPVAPEQAGAVTGSQPIVVTTPPPTPDTLPKKPVTLVALQVSPQAASAVSKKPEAITPTPQPVRAADGAVSDAKPVPHNSRLRVFLAPRRVIYPAIPSSGISTDYREDILVKALVSANGTVDDVQVPGRTLSLASAISTTVKQWRYQPYLLNGQPVEVETQMIFTVLGPDAITVRFLPAEESQVLTRNSGADR